MRKTHVLQYILASKTAQCSLSFLFSLLFVHNIIYRGCVFLFLQQELSGHEDLSEVTYLELQVNTTENSLGNFGQ